MHYHNYQTSWAADRTAWLTSLCFAELRPWILSFWWQLLLLCPLLLLLLLTHWIEVLFDMSLTWAALVTLGSDGRRALLNCFTLCIFSCVSFVSGGSNTCTKSVIAMHKQILHLMLKYLNNDCSAVHNYTYQLCNMAVLLHWYCDAHKNIAWVVLRVWRLCSYSVRLGTTQGLRGDSCIWAMEMSGIDSMSDVGGLRSSQSPFGPFEDGPTSLAQRLPNMVGRMRQDYVRDTYVLAANVTLSFFLPSGQVSVNTILISAHVLFCLRLTNATTA
jgi:hypothetical protein